MKKDEESLHRARRLVSEHRHAVPRRVSRESQGLDALVYHVEYRHHAQDHVLRDPSASHFGPTKWSTKQDGPRSHHGERSGQERMVVVNIGRRWQRSRAKKSCRADEYDEWFDRSAKSALSERDAHWRARPCYTVAIGFGRFLGCWGGGNGC